MWEARSLGFASGLGGGVSDFIGGWAALGGDERGLGAIEMFPLSTRNGNSARQNKPGRNIGNQNDHDQDQTGGPGLAVPVVIRRNGALVDHDRQGGGGLVNTSPK